MTTHHRTTRRTLLQSIAVLACILVLSGCAAAQNVVIVVIDGARYTESFGAGATYMPRIWNHLRPKGTIYTNFRNDGVTVTCPGHAAVLTGAWEDLPNDGTLRPSSPTIFEHFRKYTGLPAHSCYVVSGKEKLEMLTYSLDSAYGEAYGATFVSGETTSDSATWKKLMEAMDAHHPRLILINFPSVDVMGHAKDWEGYLDAIRGADGLVDRLWAKIESDSVYRGSTTMLVTNDHGRHDPEHGDFRNHGDSCEGCRHIMLLAVGPDFPAGAVVADHRAQTDIAPTVGTILRFPFPQRQGKSLLPAPRPPSPGK